MNTFDLHQKQERYRRFLRVFDYHSPSRPKEDKDDNHRLAGFIDKYQIVQFFLSLLASFDKEKHLHCSVAAFEASVNDWNAANPTKKVACRELIEKYYVLQANGRAIINPAIKVLFDDPGYRNLPEVAFLQNFSKSMFQYPLFQIHTWEQLLHKHNERLAQKLTEADLLAESEDLHKAIFQNRNNLKDVFYQALKIFILNTGYKTWEESIDHYFYLLLELDIAEIYLTDVINSMDVHKLRVLAGYAARRLQEEKDIFSLEDPNYLMRLKYVPYEIKGENIYSPRESSKIIPYDKNRYKLKNQFKAFEVTGLFYDDFEFRHYYEYLIPEVKFIFRYLAEYISPKEFEDIFSRINSNIYRFYFSLYGHQKPSCLVEYKSIELIPVIIHNVLSLSPDYYLQEQALFNIEEFKIELVKYFIDRISDNGEQYFNLLLDLYFYLPTGPSSFGNNNGYRQKQRIRQYVIEKAVDYLNNYSVPERFFQIFNDQAPGDDFAVYDLLIKYAQNTPQNQETVAVMLVNKYIDLLNQERFYSTYFKVDPIVKTHFLKI